MFKMSMGLFIVGTFSLIGFVVMGSYYLVLSKVSRKLFKNLPPGIVHRLFVFTSILVFAYILRWPLLEMLPHAFYLSLIVVLIALVSAWFEPRMQTMRLNIFFIILCLASLGNALHSIITTEPRVSIGRLEYESHQALYDRIAFRTKPNVYYILSDGYPNRDALEKIYGINNLDFFQQLESSGFTIYHSAFSNYMFTSASVASLFSMSHHYYGGSIGNFELLDAKELIAGKENPVVRIFKNNGYQVDYVHQKDAFFTRGCFIDLCSPKAFWGGAIYTIAPKRFHFIIKSMTYQSLDGLEGRALRHIDKISADHRPHFVYIHMLAPGHSDTPQQTVEGLASFRKGYLRWIQSANDRIMKLVQQIVTRDPNALIILGGDHGGWGLGTPRGAKKEVLDGVPDDLIALDQLGTHLSIRWPGDASKYDREIRTSVNLFRYIFAFLSKSEDILATKAPDHGFIQRVKGEASTVFKVVHDGEVLEQMVEMDPVK